MFIESIIIDFIKVMTFTWYLSLISGAKTYRIGMAGFVIVYMLPGLTLYLPAVLIFSYRLIVGILYIRIKNQQEFLQSLSAAAFSYILTEAACFLVAVFVYYFPVLLYSEVHTGMVEIVIILLQGFFAISIGGFFVRKITAFFYNTRKRIQMGIALICSTLVFISTKVGRITYIVVSILNLIFWIMDENDEKKKIRELTSYAHRTREVIPSIRRALERTDLEMEELLEELRSICDAEQRESIQEFRSIKGFESTGMIIMDEQLRRYLEEAKRNQFELDIIVMEPVNKIILEQKIGRLQLLQIIGDMYRNANRAVAKIANGRILIRFGSNLNNTYEISFYDNGELFNDYVLANLGVRGATTSGSGHGIADTLVVLNRIKASFVIEQPLAEHNIFTKGIRIVFDRRSRIKVT